MKMAEKILKTLESQPKASDSLDDHIQRLNDRITNMYTLTVPNMGLEKKLKQFDKDRGTDLSGKFKAFEQKKGEMIKAFNDLTSAYSAASKK